MTPYWAWLMRIDSRDSDVRRRGRNVIILALGMIVTVLIFMLLVATQPDSALSLAILAVCALIFVGVLLIVRRGYVTPGASVFVASLLLATLGSSLMSGILSVIPFYLILPVIVASL